MEFYRRKSLFNIMDEERNALRSSPTRVSIITQDEISDQDLDFSPCTPSSPHPRVLRIMPPPSPESPWTVSPVQTPSPSLLYQCIASLYRHEGTIYSIAVSKGVVFTGSESKRIHAWKQLDCAEHGYLKSTSGEVRATLAHGSMLFTAHKDNRIRIWNFTVSDNFRWKKSWSLPSKRGPFPFFLRSSPEQHKDCISCLAYYYAEGLLYTGSFDKTVKAWRVSSQKCVDSFVAHEDKVNAILVKQDDGCVFTCSSDGSVKIWRRVYRENSHTLTITLKFQPSPVYAIALSPSFSSCFLYSGSSDGTINFWEKERMSYRFNHGGFLQGHRFAVLCLVAVEKLIFSGSEDTSIKIWRREEGSCFHECLAVLEGHRGPVRCLAACLEIEKIVMGFLVYSASLDQTFKVWRIKVLPEESVCFDSMDFNDSRTTECEMNPVLSPSWVKNKLLGTQYFH